MQSNKKRSAIESYELRVVGIERGYLFAGDESWHYMYCCCLSLGVEFMAHIKAPHHVADRQYIFSRTGDHDSCCLRETTTEISLNHHAGNLSACGLVCRPQSFGLGIELCFYISVFPTPSPPSPPPLSWVIYLESYHSYCPDPSLQCTNIFVSRISCHIIQHIQLHTANSTCINIRGSSLSACSGGHSGAQHVCVHLAACAPLHIVLFYSCLTLN